MHALTHKLGAAIPWLAALALTAATPPLNATVVVGGVTFDTANGTTTAKIVSGGYTTVHGTALPSSTSADWTAGRSLGTYFQVPSFQSGYDSVSQVSGTAGTAATLGQDPNFPATGNVRDIIELTWGDGNGLTNGTGDDLAVFEQFTSEAFAIRVHLTEGAWSNWIYNEHNRTYDAAMDATATLFDLEDFGVITYINALQITNLIDGDTVDSLLSGDLGFGQVTFLGAGTPGPYKPGRYSTSAGDYVAFEAGKYDPDIQYVVALHAITQGGVSKDISSFASGSPLSSPAWAAPTNVPEPAGITLVALGLGLVGLGRRSSRPSRAGH